MNFKDFQKAIAEKKVTISEMEFVEKTAEVMGSDDVAGLIAANPTLMLAFTMFSVELSRAIFKNDKDDEREVTE